MNLVDEYISSIEESRRIKIEKIVEFLRLNYSGIQESLDYAPKTKFPFFKYNNNYVAIASMKNHISVHFSSYEATEIVYNSNNKVIKRVGCVNIKDNIDFPYDGIFEAIKKTFS